MINFYGYNDARAMAAYNKRNLTKIFLIYALVCFFVSIIAILIPLYELLYVWGVFLFLLLITLFAASFSKYEDKALKKAGIKTKHIFRIEEFKLFKGNNEIKQKEHIMFYSYKKYILLELKKSYYYIPKDELQISINELTERLREVIYGTSIEKIIESIKDYIDCNAIKGNFDFTKDTFVWILGSNKFTFYIELREILINHEKLRFNKHYVNYTHYHIDKSEINETIKEFNEKYDGILR
jgi:hypothetical protein